jgi:hypothetical protein
MVVGPLALAAFGYFIVWVANRNVKRQQRLIDESTPVDAIIVGSRVGTTTPGRDNSTNAKSAYVTFEYEYKGESYQSRHLRPGGAQFGSASGPIDTTRVRLSRRTSPSLIPEWGFWRKRHPVGVTS